MCPGGHTLSNMPHSSRGRCPHRPDSMYCGSVGSECPGTDVKPQYVKFSTVPGPLWAQIEPQGITQISTRRKFSDHAKGWPRNGGSGGKRSYGPRRSTAEPWSIGRVPRRSFGDFPIAGKVTRRPQAAKFPLQNGTERRGGGRPHGAAPTREGESVLHPQAARSPAKQFRKEGNLCEAPKQFSHQ